LKYVSISSLMCVIDFAVDGEGASISAFMCQELVNFTQGENSSAWGILTRDASLFSARKKEKRKKRKNHANSKKLLTSIKEKGPLGKKRPFTRKEKEGSVRMRRVVDRQTSRPLLICLKVGRMLKRTSGLNKLMSIVHRISMEFESKFLDSL